MNCLAHLKRAPLKGDGIAAQGESALCADVALGYASEESAALKGAAVYTLINPKLIAQPRQCCVDLITVDSPPDGDPRSDRQVSSRFHQYRRAFSLIEVLVALGIFFVCIFAILELTTNSLRAARRLQNSQPNPGMLAAYVSTYTNRLQEGVDEGDFQDYPDYTWRRDIVMVETNGLFRADFWVSGKDFKPTQEPTLSIYLFRPNSLNRRAGR